MKRLFAMLLLTALCLSAFSGCEFLDLFEKREETTTTFSEAPTTAPTDDDLPPEDDDSLKTLAPLLFKETVTFEEERSLLAQITEKPFLNAFVVSVWTTHAQQEWGEYVYVMMDDVDEWCVGDFVIVYFTKAEHPQDTTKYARIFADRVELDMPMPEKPIIYLYPEVPTFCSVKVEINGALTCTYPDYGTDGWQNFVAYPDGTLIFPDGKEYYALYWEGVQAGEADFSQGFCVCGKDTAAFLEWALAEQGLTRREANEFIVYWLPQMQDNPYNVISFQGAVYTENAALEISPAPDSLLRVFMAYYPSDAEVEIAPQSFDGFVREGFTVVEWGGCQVTHP